MNTLSDKTILVVGASRGLGRAAATAFAAAGADVVAVSRTPTDFSETPNGSGNIRSEIADAQDASAAATLLRQYNPHAVVMVAGAVPHISPLLEQSWETFSVNWQTDVQITFNWLREALRVPLAPGSRVIVVSSGAAIAGSPLSGGYAGAKATQRFITGYAQREANGAGIGIAFTTVLPQFAPETAVGKGAVAAYAAQANQSVETYLDQLPFPPLTSEIAGDALVVLTQADPDTLAPEHLLNGAGLKALS
jgi:3-oxoacyl-[acyl-carrier protein] reductase